MASPTRSARNTGGFSLDQAARLYRSTLDPARPVLCPNCDIPINPVVAEERVEDVWFVRCERCGCGVVLRRPSGKSGA